jgi:retron-type reverse transcriptase
MSRLEKAAIASQTLLGEYGLSANASKAAPIFHMGIPTVHNRFLEAQIKNSLKRSVDPALLARVRAKIQHFLTAKAK